MAENRELALVLKLVASQFQDELKKSGGMLGDFTGFIFDWKTQLVAAGGALFAIAKSTANYGDELVKSSQRMGTSIEDTARLQHAAKLADTDLQGLTKTVGFLSKEMFAASTGNAEAKRTFDLLGISATTANGQLKGTKQMLIELGDKFRMMPEGPEKTALAMLTLGKTGKDVLPLLNSNLREAFEESDRLGLTMDGKAAKAAEHFNDELTKLQGAIRGVTNDVGTLLIPKFDAVAHGLTTIITDSRSAVAALGELFKLNRADQPTVGIVQPSDGGRRLRILPPPPDVDKAVVQPFFQTEAQANEQEAIGKRLVEQFSAQFKVMQSQGKEQEELGKALLEIWLTGNRALEMRIRLEQESLDKEQERIDLSEELDAEVQEERIDKERESLIANEQAWVAYYEQLGGEAQNFLAHKTALLEAQLAKELDLTKEQSVQLLAAWQNRDSLRADAILKFSPVSEIQKETVELNTMNQAIRNAREANGSFFDGWSKGMSDYVRQSGNGFNLATDMARSTAQAMQLGFRNFFFDVMDNKINSLKEVFRSLLGFVKQIIATITAQLVTSSILNYVTSVGAGASGVSIPGLSNNFGNFGVRSAAGGQVVQRFAMGGPVPGFGTRDTVPALLTPGEVVLSRTDVQDIKRGVSGGNQITTNITIQANGERRESGSGTAPNFAQLARDLSKLVESKLIDEQRPGGLLAGGRA